MFEKNKINQLKSDAENFRRAIEENLNRLECPITFKEFPRGSCGDACLLLGQYLSDRGYGVFDKIVGYSAIIGTHAWLEKNNLILDITRDQFPDFEEKVYLGNKIDWYKAYPTKDKVKALLGEEDKPNIDKLWIFYRVLINFLRRKIKT
jgi:hypothetical protein